MARKVKVRGGVPRLQCAPPRASDARPGVNLSESPIGWLRRRRDKDGEPLISQAEFDAGERLRADFWFAQMTPRVTADWSSGPSGHARRAAPGHGVEMQDGVIAARDRVHRALAAVGPELSGVLIDVCCHLKGLEEAERGAGWPQRCGKVVLRVALAGLARHYGLVCPATGSGRVRHWGGEDYRPELDTSEF
jgi:Domain of unknown function (DUF6456)